MTRTFGTRHEWGRLHEAAVGLSSPLAEVLQAQGVTVHRVDTPAPRDPLVVVGRHVIEASLRGEARRHERLALRPLVQDLVQRCRLDWSCVPPGWPNGVDGPFLEGGDVLVNGREVYVGMSGRASDMAGIDWLAARLGPDHRVIPVAMRSNVLHLEDVLTLVRPGLLIFCPSLLIDGLPMSLRSWEAIAVSAADVEQGRGQLLVLAAGRAIARADDGRVAELLRQHRVEVIEVHCQGGLRAAHQPLLRESAPE